MKGAQPEPATAAEPFARRPAWLPALFGLACGSILIPLNSTMLSVALPQIMVDFGVDAGTVSWLVTLYLAAVALVVPLSGNLGDRFGHRRLFLVGVAAFAASSLLAALARTFPLLVAARLLQAASGAAITPNAASLIRMAAPEQARGGSFGLYDLMISTSASVGPFIGGLLVSALGWRALFSLALPLAALSLVLVNRLVGVDRPAPGRRAFDLVGLLLLSAALLALLATLYALRGGAWGGWAAVGAVLLALFVRRELRVAVPVMDVRLFRIVPFAAAVGAVLGATIILHSTMIIVPIFTQNILGASAAASGTVLLGFFVLGAMVAPIAGRASDRVGRRAPAVAGSLCMVLALVGLWLSGGRGGLVSVTALLAFVGVGFGLSGSPRQTAALESVPERVTGMAAGAYFTVRYVGGVVGASLAGVMLGRVVTPGAVASAFGALALVAAGVTLLSFGLRGRR